MNGYDRLKQLYKSGERKDEPLIKVIKYLLQQTNMNELYLKEEKSLKQMMEFISDKAKELAFNHVAIIEDEIVYNWALEYFNKTNEELGLNKPPKSPPKQVKQEVESNNDQLTLGV